MLMLGPVLERLHDEPLDPDGTIEAYADMTGVPSGVMVDRRQAMAIRQQRAQQQAKQAALQQAMTLVQGAKTASEIDVGGGQNAVSAGARPS